MNQSCPIVAMTANAFAEDVKKSLDMGMNAHLSKPINPQEIVNVLKKYNVNVVNTTE